MMPKYYRLCLAKGAPLSGVKIWKGCPTDPVTGELLTERPAIWRAEVNGQQEPIEQVAPWFLDGTGNEMRGTEITEADYRYYVETHKWAVQYAPTDYAAKPRDAIDHLKGDLIF